MCPWEYDRTMKAAVGGVKQVRSPAQHHQQPGRSSHHDWAHQVVHQVDKVRTRISNTTHSSVLSHCHQYSEAQGIRSSWKKVQQRPRQCEISVQTMCMELCTFSLQGWWWWVWWFPITYTIGFAMGKSQPKSSAFYIDSSRKLRVWLL